MNTQAIVPNSKRKLRLQFQQNFSVLLALLIFLGGFSPLSAAPGTFLGPGSLASTTELLDLDDNLCSFPVKGKWNLIFFWSLFCHSCIEEMPDLTRQLQDISPNICEQFFISLDTKRMKKAVINFVKRRHLTCRVLLEQIASQSYRTADMFGVTTTPATFLISPKGIVVFSRCGPFDLAELFEELRSITPESATATHVCDTASQTSDNRSECAEPHLVPQD